MFSQVFRRAERLSQGRTDAHVLYGSPCTSQQKHPCLSFSRCMLLHAGFHQIDYLVVWQFW